MNIIEYQAKSKRTLNNDLTEEQLISNMVMGITGETGEVVDILKKWMYQGHTLKLNDIEEELGDVMFYIVNLCNLLGLELQDSINNNYNKLLKRYPEGFSTERSVNREQ